MPQKEKTISISLIGMPGAGKSTVGGQLASLLGFAFIDTDLIIESLYARRLQDITDAMPRQAFLDAESDVIRALNAPRAVIATGGSAIYRPEAMRHLKSMGPVVYLRLSLSEVKARVALNPERGISFGPGQTLEQLFAERCALYEQHADCQCDTGKFTPEECANCIAEQLELQARGSAR